MKAPTRREAAALAAGSAEMNREQWWHMLPMRERERALSVAGINPARAAQPLATFTDTERERVRLCIGAHIAQMQLVAQVMAAHNTNVAGLLH